MDRKSFLQAGHTPTLLAAFLYFDLAFMVWVILGPLGVQIASDLGLSHTQKGLMVATPVLAGALLRIVMGVLVDHLKPKLAQGLAHQIAGESIAAQTARTMPEIILRKWVPPGKMPATKSKKLYPGRSRLLLALKP